MHKYLRNRCKVFVIILPLAFAGCATPASVRTLSSEQVKAQEGYLQSQEQYFSVIEKYIDSQIKVAELLIATETKNINEMYKKQALADIDPADNAKTKNAIDKLTSDVLTEQRLDQERLASIKNSAVQLKELHRQMLSTLSTILSAQKKLNEYIQLQKADEQAVNQLLSIIGIEREKVDRGTATAADILAAINKGKVAIK